jgi:hypothetical protein
MTGGSSIFVDGAMVVNGRRPYDRRKPPDFTKDLVLPHLDDAACNSPDVDPELFWPQTIRGQTVYPGELTARMLCWGCPDREPCLRFIDEFETRFQREDSIWAAELPTERQARRRREQVAR